MDGGIVQRGAVIQHYYKLSSILAIIVVGRSLLWLCPSHPLPFDSIQLRLMIKWKLFELKYVQTFPEPHTAGAGAAAAAAGAV